MPTIEKSTMSSSAPSESVDATDFIPELNPHESLANELIKAYERLEKTLPGIRAKLESLNNEEERDQLSTDLEHVINLDESLPE